MLPDDNLTHRDWPSDLSGALQFRPAELVGEPILSLPAQPHGLPETHHSAWKEFTERTGPAAPRHQLLGHSATTDSLPEDIQLLLQISEDAITGFTFADGGQLYVWVTTGRPIATDTARITLFSY